MHIKPYLPYIGIAALTLGLAVLAGYANLRQHSPNSGQAATISVIWPGRPLSNFEVQTIRGKTLNRDALRGHWSLIVFGDADCAPRCRSNLNALAAATSELGTLPPVEYPHVYLISVDPQPEHAPEFKTFLQRFYPDFTGATGSEEQLKVLALGLRTGFSRLPVDKYAHYLARHPARILVVDPDARQIATMKLPLTREQISAQYRFFLKLYKARS